jgi:exosortase/archaeosortase family protein
MIYASAFWWAPSLVQAMIAVTAGALLLSPQIFGQRFHVGAWALAVLSLPLLSSLQFYLGYPLRLAVSKLAASFLGMAGFSVSPEGAALVWAGQPLVIDAPCSGIRMLWVTLYLAATLSCLLRLDASRTLVLLGTGGVLAILGNVARAAALFLTQPVLLDRLISFAVPGWMHEIVGLASFVPVVVVLCLYARWLASGIITAASRAPAGIPKTASTRNPVALLLYAAVACCSALVPLLPVQAVRPLSQSPFPGFPGSFEGRPLLPVPLSAEERRFSEGFPGRIGKFACGQRQVVFRWIYKETRQLHPAADCLKASGYSITPLPIFVDQSGCQWAQTEAARRASRLVVRERITDKTGASWTDVSEWYWAALLRRTTGPWWAISVIASQRRPLPLA